MLGLRPILPLQDKDKLLPNDLTVTQNRMHGVMDTVIIEFSLPAVDRFAGLTSGLEDSVPIEEPNKHR
jgi:hypothetical protein